MSTAAVDIVDSQKQEDGNNNSPSDDRPQQVHSHPVLKDEYMEDPLPDLVGSLIVSEELDPDLMLCTNNLDYFTLEDFEFTISDEEGEHFVDASSSSVPTNSTTNPIEDEDDDDSDIEFFDVTNFTSKDKNSNQTELSIARRHDLPEVENVSVELVHHEDELVSAGGSSTSRGNNQVPIVPSRLNLIKEKVKNILRKKFENDKLFTPKKNIRVLYQNLDKPYTVRVSIMASQQFRRFLTLGQGF